MPILSFIWPSNLWNTCGNVVHAPPRWGKVGPLIVSVLARFAGQKGVKVASMKNFWSSHSAAQPQPSDLAIMVKERPLQALTLNLCWCHLTFFLSYIVSMWGDLLHLCCDNNRQHVSPWCCPQRQCGRPWRRPHLQLWWRRT
jgi:hypothetical protein